MKSIKLGFAVALAGSAALAACDDKRAAIADAATVPAPGLAYVAPEVPTVVWDSAARQDALLKGSAVMVKHECTRCHAIDDLPAAARPLACTGCHQFMQGLRPGDKTYDALVDKWGKDVIARYQRNIFHLQKVPVLTGLGRRVRADYVAHFLEEPFDQRPMLGDSMIRHALSAVEIRAVARYFAAKAEAADPWASDYVAPALPPKPDDARLARGGELFKTRACPTCHTFGNVDLGVSKAALVAGRAANLLAPNLRFVRDRTRPDAIVTWIMAPSSLLKDTPMPSLGLSRDEAEAVRDYLYYADPQLVAAPAPAPTRPVAILARPVPYAEMKERVLGATCVHCHMNDYEKDTGPGNKGGLGYAGVGLRMRTYETLVEGAIGADGKRYSVLAPRPGETVAPIIDVMLRRRAEEQRDHVEPFADYERPHYPGDRPAMPMGLPSMSDEQISLLATWIAQGCKGAAAVTGKPGTSDGYLVPDGPIAHNAGCGLRGPESPRPSWAVDNK